MPDIGVPELLVVLVIIIVLFGPSRLTDIMGALGKGLSEFRKATSNTTATKPAEIKASSGTQDTTIQDEPPKNS